MKTKAEVKRKKAEVFCRELKRVDCKHGSLRLCKYKLGQTPFSTEVWAPLAGDWVPFASHRTLEAAIKDMEAATARFGGVA